MLQELCRYFIPALDDCAALVLWCFKSKFEKIDKSSLDCVEMWFWGQFLGSTTALLKSLNNIPRL